MRTLAFLIFTSCALKWTTLGSLWVNFVRYPRRLLYLRGAGEVSVKPFVHREELHKENHPAESLFGTDARKRLAKRLLRSNTLDEADQEEMHRAKVFIKRAADEDLIVPDQCESLKEALRQALPGQVVFVRAGEHRWRAELSAPVNVTTDIRGELGARLWGQWARRGQQVRSNIS